MVKRIVILSLFVILLLGTFSIFKLSPSFTKALAQTSCTEFPSSGNVSTMTINVSESNTYTLWSRMIVPDDMNNSFWVQIDDGCAINVGDSHFITPNQLTWINYKNGATKDVLSLNLAAGTHTVKIIEREPGVGIDRLIFTADPNCAFSETGNNCPPPTPKL